MSTSPIQSLVVLCIMVTGILVVAGARKQAAKAFFVALALGTADALIPRIWSATMSMAAGMPLWFDIVAAPFVILFVVFATLRVFQAIIARIYGRYVAVRLTASALGSTFYWIGRAVWFVITLPVRLFAHRPSIDELLRDWRRG
jgi:L-cystine uptake protein TcyP (sodium:dicarboxylate symporter family)